MTTTSEIMTTLRDCVAELDGLSVEELTARFGPAEGDLFSNPIAAHLETAVNRRLQPSLGVVISASGRIGAVASNVIHQQGNSVPLPPAVATYLAPVRWDGSHRARQSR